jgi:ATP-dependent DNA ligase
MAAPFLPMPLGQRHAPFDHPDWFFELKYDGCRALAYVDGRGATLVSRRNIEYRAFEDLASQLSLELSADDAVLDGEIGESCPAVVAPGCRVRGRNAGLSVPFLRPAT